MSRCLIVGGPHDGEWAEVNPRRQFLELVVRPPAPVSVVQYFDPVEPKTVQKAVYKQQQWRCGGGDDAEWLLYGPIDDSPATMFERLLRGYRRPKP